jgi:hypothetical protein
VASGASCGVIEEYFLTGCWDFWHNLHSSLA